MIKVIIFDSDGMITNGPRFSVILSQKFNIPLEKILPFFNGPFKNCLIGKADLKEELQKGWLKKWGWNGSVDDFLKLWFSIGKEIDNNVYQSISRIKKKGIICALATNQEKYRTEHLSKRFNYNALFDKIFSSAYVGSKKPSVEFFTEIFECFKEKDANIKKDEIIFWDDDQKNINGAKEFGFHAEIFTDYNSYWNKMKKLI